MYQDNKEILRILKKHPTGIHPDQAYLWREIQVFKFGPEVFQLRIKNTGVAGIPWWMRANNGYVEQTIVLTNEMGDTLQKIENENIISIGESMIGMKEEAKNVHYALVFERGYNVAAPASESKWYQSLIIYESFGAGQRPVELLAIQIEFYSRLSRT